eukprot:20732-Heterococcus_DN1.PRE.4
MQQPLSSISITTTAATCTRSYRNYLVYRAVEEQCDARDDLVPRGLTQRYALALPFQPLLQLALPVRYKRRWTDHHSAARSWLPFFSPLLQQRPQHSYALQCLAQPHVVCQDAALSLHFPQAHQALEHELHALPLVRPQELAQPRVYCDGVRRVAAVVALPQDEGLHRGRSW